MSRRLDHMFKEMEVDHSLAMPAPDIAICSKCGWRGPTTECERDEEGDWESGYRMIDLCPKCDDGGCIDDYDMSEERQKSWEAWMENKES